jgi:hypothetical protein
MASAFWILEDGRGFSIRWSGMSHMLDLITEELKKITGAEEFYKYLEKFVFRKENGDEYNGYGGFVRDNDNIMLNFDLRSFTPTNRNYFWKAAQRALTRIKLKNDEKNEGIVFLFTTLLDMHKRIKRGENPMELSHIDIIEPEPNEKLGPGWS